MTYRPSALVLLAKKVYNPASPVQLSRASNSAFADVDATNLAVTFVAPTSGSVLVRLSALCFTSAGSHFWNLRDGSGDIVGTRAEINSIASRNRFTATLSKTGLTPGTSYTWKWGYANAGGTHTIYAGDDGSSPQDAGSDVGAAVMEVLSA